MNRPNSDERRTTASGRYDWLRRYGATASVLLMVAVVVGAPIVGLTGIVTAQDNGDGGSDSFGVKQGETCYTVSPMSDGSDNVVSWYDYRTHGHGYSSRGTDDLQVQDTSQFFFYKGNGGLSLVFLHDKFTGNRTEGGGAITFVMKGLPVTGGWTVKDDGYGGADDRFTYNKSMATATWGWAGGRSDGGVYRANPSSWDRTVTITPKFNKEANSYPYPGWEGEGTMNQVQRWIVRSGDGKAHALNLYEDVQIFPGTCDEPKSGSDGGGGGSSANDDAGGVKTIASGPGFNVVLTTVALAVALIGILARNRL